MMKEEVNMDKGFREKLEGFSKEPPAYLWNGIQGQLAGRRRKKRVVWFGWIAVAALLVLAFVAGWHFNETSEKAVLQVSEKDMTGKEDEKIDSETDFSKQTLSESITETRIAENGTLPAGATGKKSPDRKPGVVTAKTSGKHEDAYPELGDLVLMEKIKPVEAKLIVEKQTVSLVAKTVSRAALAFSSREREVEVMYDTNAAWYTRTSKARTGWKMGLNISPGYSSYSARHSSDYARNMTYADSKGNGNISGGISVQYKTGKRWSVESGVSYAQNGQQTGSSPQLFGRRAEANHTDVPAEKLYFNTAVNIAGTHMTMNSTAGIIEFDNLPEGAEIAANLETSGTYTSSLLTEGELSQVFNFVEIPVYLRYLLIDSKMDVELMGGFNAGMVVGNNAFIDNEYGVQNIGKTRDISMVNVSGTVGVGLTYALGKHVSLAVEPRLSYYMNSINRDPHVVFRPYRAGIYTGLYYEF